MGYQGHVLMERCAGLVVGAVITHADSKGETAMALAMFGTLPEARRWEGSGWSFEAVSNGLISTSY